MALTVGDVMTHNVITVSPQMPVAEAAELLAAHRITGMPVVDERRTLVGVVSDFDIIGKSGRTVGEIMTRGVISVSPQTPLEEAAHILTGARIQAEQNTRAADLPPLSEADMRTVQEVYDRLIRPQVHHLW